MSLLEIAQVVIVGVLLLEQFHGQRPLVILQRDVEQVALQKNPPGATAKSRLGEPCFLSRPLKTTEHPGKALDEALQDVVLLVRGLPLVEVPLAAGQLFMAEVSQEPGLELIVAVRFVPPVHMEMVIVDVVQALILILKRENLLFCFDLHLSCLCAALGSFHFAHFPF